MILKKYTLLLALLVSYGSICSSALIAADLFGERGAVAETAILPKRDLALEVAGADDPDAGALVVLLHMYEREFATRSIRLNESTVSWINDCRNKVINSFSNISTKSLTGFNERIDWVIEVFYTDQARIRELSFKKVTDWVNNPNTLESEKEHVYSMVEALTRNPKLNSFDANVLDALSYYHSFNGFLTRPEALSKVRQALQLPLTPRPHDLSDNIRQGFDRYGSYALFATAFLEQALTTDKFPGLTKYPVARGLFNAYFAFKVLPEACEKLYNGYKLNKKAKSVVGALWTIAANRAKGSLLQFAGSVAAFNF